jgi:tetratricopeptide (TPR) repeat protein
MTTSESLKTYTVTLELADLQRTYPNLNLKTAQDLAALSQLLKEKYRGASAKLDVKETEGQKLQVTWQQLRPPLEAEKLNQEALGLARKREFDNAINCWRKAIDIFPQEAEYHYNSALLFLEQGNNLRGLERLQETHKLCPVYTRAYFVLGSIYSKMRQFQPSVQYLKEGLLLQNNNVLAMVNLAAVYSVEKNYPEAIRVFERVIALSPKEARAYLGLGKIYVAQNDIDNATRCFKAVIKLDPDGKLAEIARKSLRAFAPAEHPPANTESPASMADEENIEELYAEGFQAFIKGDYEKASAAYKRYLNARPAESDVWSSLASCQLRLGRTKEAIDAIRRAVAIAPNKPALFKQAAIIYDASDLWAESAEAAQKAIDLGRNDSVTLTLLGKSRSLEGKHQEALRVLQEAVKLNPSNINARYHYALSLKALGQLETAKQQLEEIMWTRTDSPLKEKAQKELQNI